VVSAAAERLSCCGDDLVVGDAAEPLGDVPAVSERVGELSVALAPERVGELVAASAPALSARVQRPSASSVLICRTVAVPPIASGATLPMSGNSLPKCTTESPKASSTLITL
jgi:hypothetical protein